jgi:hypothetical protein
MTVINSKPSPNTTGSPNNLQPQVTTLGSPPASMAGTSQPVNELPPPPTAPAAPPVPPAKDNPLGGMMGGGTDANVLDKFFQHLDTVPEGKYGAKIVDFTLGMNNFGELRSTMLFEFLAGELAGMLYAYGQKVTEKSFRYLKSNLQVASGQTLAQANEVYDHLNDCAGPIRDRIVGAVVEIVVVHRESNDRTYVNIDIVKLLQPAPLGTGHSNNIE